jgi:acylpyruvate hydrolase
VRLLKFELEGRVRTGVRVGEGVLDLTDRLPALATLEAILASGDAGLQSIRSAIAAGGQTLQAASVRWLEPVGRAAKVIGIGLNYKDHAAEIGAAIPQEPVVFLRTVTSLTAHGSPIEATPLSEQLDFEGELAVVIGQPARNVSRAQALRHVFGYTVANDGSVRDFQLRTPQWTLGKNFDRTAGVGPEIVTADELPAGASGLAIETRLNGQVVQASNTRELIFDVADLVSRLSAVMTLNPGDVILTGTPGGVGGLRKPPLWMKPGDTCEVQIERIGTLVNRVERPRAAQPS